MNGPSSPRIALLNSVPDGTESRIITHICEGLCAEGLVAEVIDGRGQILRLAVLRAIMRCDLLIVHSALAYAVFYVAFARLFGKPVAALVWDYYPVTLGGERYDRSPRRRLLDALENLALGLCSHLIVPSRDFLGFGRLARARVVPFWLPVRPQASVAAPKAQVDQPKSARIIFAGQVNATRGLTEAYAALEQKLGMPFDLIIASRSPLPPELECKDNVQHLGYLGHAALQAEMAKCHAGLVALAPKFDGPGLPSKTWDYLEGGLPCLFSGKHLPHYVAALEESGAGIVLSGAARGRVKTILLRRDSDEMAAAAKAFSARFELNAVLLADRLHEILAAAKEGPRRPDQKNSEQ